MSLTVGLVTQEQELYSGNADQITVPGVMGDMTILPEHEALMSTLQAGEVVIIEQGQERRFIISPGFIQVVDDVVTVLTDSAVRNEDLDEHAAEEARQSAEVAMQEAISDTEIAMTAGMIERTLIELRTIRRRKHQTH